LLKKEIAISRESPHIVGLGRNLTHTAGRSALPNILQRLAVSNCIHRTPAGLPLGMPGIADEIDGAIQQAPQSVRQFMTINPSLRQ
jgi:hypothetical protein